MTVWLKVVLVGTGGALGARARWGIGELALKFGHAAPLATLCVNLLGCFLIGGAKAAIDAAGWGTPELRIFLITGVLGAFTTFSTFEADTFGLWRVDQRGWAIAYLFASVIGGLVMFVGGWWLTQRIAS